MLTQDNYVAGVVIANSQYKVLNDVANKIYIRDLCGND